MKHWVIAAALCSAFAASAAPLEWVSAKVVKVDPERSRVTLDHARIESINMDAMVMPFKVGTAVSLKQFRAGDKVRFRVVNRDDHLVVEAMEKLK